MGSESDIKILTVHDGDGQELKDARFVEVLKSAKNRLKSAASSGRQRFARRKIQMLDDEEHRYDSGGTFVVKGLDNLEATRLRIHNSPNSLYHRESEIPQFYYGKRIPDEGSRIFKIVDNTDRLRNPRRELDDIQVLRLDDDAEGNRDSLTYRKVGNAEILDLEDQKSYITAVGPDGQEFILKRYLNGVTPDQDPSIEPGFLNMAMSHLKDQQYPASFDG